MALGRPWSFVQLGGNRTQLQLNGYSAPFGRPRKGTLVNSGVKVRRSVTYYPGKRRPTIHVFGLEPRPWILHGRWMDQAIGAAGAAQDTARSWKTFVTDGQEVRATWGNILSYRIFIDEFDIEWESEAECAWKISAIAIEDDSDAVPPSIAMVRHPQDLTAEMQSQLATATLQTPKASLLDNALALLPDIADRIDSIVSLINTPAATLLAVAGELSDFESALTTDLTKLTGSSQEIKTALLELQDATGNLVARAEGLQDAFSNTLSLGGSPILSASDVTALRAQKIAADAATANFLALVADLLDQVDRVSRGQQRTTIIATTGDTWEGLAWRAMGSADGARTLKAMNGVRGGEQPIPGKTYIVPAKAA